MRQEVCASYRLAAIAVLGGFLLTAAGCQKPAKIKVDYNRPLPPGASALRLLLDHSKWPDLKTSWTKSDPELLAALDRSSRWYAVPSSARFFPMRDVTHLRAQTSVYAFKQLLLEANSPDEFERRIRDEFNCYTSVGFDDQGTVLYTGYFTPIFKASPVQTDVYRYPLYRKPADLDIEPLTGKVLGRKVGAAHQPYPSRAEIEQKRILDGQSLELAWVAGRLEQYVIQVNGSAKLEMPGGKALYIGYAGNNGHDYTGLGATLVREGVIEPERLGLASIREYFRDKPQELERYINMNDRYVFFTEYDGEAWPAGSLGVKVAVQRSLATDKEIFPRGSVVVVTTKVPTADGSQRDFQQIMLDQDTGGAIRAAGRGDIYMGIGPSAERVAGRQFAEGRLYYFFLKNERVLEWRQRVQDDPALQKPAPPAHAPGKIATVEP